MGQELHGEVPLGGEESNVELVQLNDDPFRGEVHGAGVCVEDLTSRLLP
jgi:hypothetical protein